MNDLITSKKDSAGLPDILISDDLSNLPPGQRAVRREDLDD